MCNPEFMLQQPFFSPQTSGISNQTFIAANNTMTWNDDSNFIFSTGGSGSTYHFYITKLFRQFEITNGFAKRNVEQFAPHSLLKRSAFLVYRYIKTSAFAIKKFNQLFRTLMHYFAYAGLTMRYLVLIVYKT